MKELNRLNIVGYKIYISLGYKQPSSSTKSNKRKGAVSRRALVVTSYGLPNIPYGSYGNAEGFLRNYRYNFSASSSQSAAEASEGIRQSPRGESDTEPTFTPSGAQLRLNCCAKNLR